MENSRGKLRRNDNQCQRGVMRANIERLVPAAGVEPATSRSGGERSNPLSYAGLNKIAGFKEVHKKCTPFCTPFVSPRQLRSALGWLLVVDDDRDLRFGTETEFSISVPGGNFG